MDQNFNQNQSYQATNQPLPPPKKSNGVKIFLIILVILIILGAGGYLGYKYYFIKYIAKDEVVARLSPPALTTATVEGVSDKITVEIPSGYTTASSDQFTSLFSDMPGVVLLNFANFQQGQDLNRAKMFGVFFVEENKYNDYKKGIETMRKAIETLHARNNDSDYQIDEETINNYRLLKHISKLQTATPTETYENSLTEYFIFTNKSYYGISRLNPLDEPNFAEEEFNQMLQSFKITAK